MHLSSLPPLGPLQACSPCQPADHVSRPHTPITTMTVVRGSVSVTRCMIETESPTTTCSGACPRDLSPGERDNIVHQVYSSANDGSQAGENVGFSIVLLCLPREGMQCVADPF